MQAYGRFKRCGNGVGLGEDSGGLRLFRIDAAFPEMLRFRTETAIKVSLRQPTSSASPTQE
jgi:hypothetical protein